MLKANFFGEINIFHIRQPYVPTNDMMRNPTPKGLFNKRKKRFSGYSG
jgi:hypothetical protein